jgi:hypothetical protein
MQRLFILFIFIFLSLFSFGQNYTSYFSGDTADVNTVTSPFTVLMGGATENDSAMIRFLENSGGGDIVVLRASGSNGYNAYMYSQSTRFKHSCVTMPLLLTTPMSLIK